MSSRRGKGVVRTDGRWASCEKAVAAAVEAAAVRRRRWATPMTTIRSSSNTTITVTKAGSDRRTNRPRCTGRGIESSGSASTALTRRAICTRRTDAILRASIPPLNRHFFVPLPLRAFLLSPHVHMSCHTPLTKPVNPSPVYTTSFAERRGEERRGRLHWTENKRLRLRVRIMRYETSRIKPEWWRRRRRRPKCQRPAPRLDRSFVAVPSSPLARTRPWPSRWAPRARQSRSARANPRPPPPPSRPNRRYSAPLSGPFRSSEP